MPQRIIKFETNVGPQWIDLEEVALVTHGAEGHEGKPAVVLKCGATWRMNHTFTADLTRFMDAWMEYKNGPAAD